MVISLSFGTAHSRMADRQFDRVGDRQSAGSPTTVDRVRRRMPARFVLVATGLVIALAGCGSKPASTNATGVYLEAEPGLPTPAASPAPTTVPSPAPVQGGLKTIDYTPAPKGFPADPDSSSTAPI